MGVEDFEVSHASGSQSGDESLNIVPDWTAEEEKRVVRKLDLTILPLLTLVFYALQLDRGNIGNALTDYFLKEVGITQYQYNIGQQLLSAGIVILEIPSNLMLYRFGPCLWISGQVFAWGSVATFQAFQKGLGAYLATRLLLGLCEAGFIPGGLYTLSLYYKRQETTKRFAFYFLGQQLASASSGLIAYGILQMRGICGLSGWQWMFLIEGIFTICCGAAFALLVPKTPNSPRNLLRYRYFTEREEYILRQRVLLDDPSKEKTSHKISMKQLGGTLSNWRIYPHVLVSLCGIAPATTMGSYAPTLVKSFGYPRLQSNALVSVGPWIQLVLNFLSGYVADVTKRRGWVSLAGISGWWGFAIGCLVLSTSSDKTARYAILACAMSFQTVWHPVNGSWLSMNCRTPAERSITMAMFVMSANIGGIIGAQLFQAEDGPRYHTGWSAIVGLLSVSIASNLFANVQYRLSNRRLAKREQAGEIDPKTAEGALLSKGWRYQL